MIDLSTREMEVLALKAARGAGLPWGLAEEAGYATSWLAQSGLSDLSCISKLLRENEKRSAGELGPGELEGIWLSPERVLCPITTGALLSDCSDMIVDREVIDIRGLAYPIILLPFAAAAAARINRCIKVSWSGFKAIVSANNIVITQGQDEIDICLAEKVAVTIATIQPTSNLQRIGRIELADDVFATLVAFAGKTHVPETEQLKNSGAGGDRVDDE